MRALVGGHRDRPNFPEALLAGLLARVLGEDMLVVVDDGLIAGSARPSGHDRPMRWLSRTMHADGGAGVAGSDLHEVAQLVGEPDGAVPELARSGRGAAADHRLGDHAGVGYLTDQGRWLVPEPIVTCPVSLSAATAISSTAAASFTARSAATAASSADRRICRTWPCPWGSKAMVVTGASGSGRAAPKSSST